MCSVELWVGVSSHTQSLTYTHTHTHTDRERNTQTPKEEEWLICISSSDVCFNPHDGETERTRDPAELCVYSFLSSLKSFLTLHGVLYDDCIA